MSSWYVREIAEAFDTWLIDNSATSGKDAEKARFDSVASAHWEWMLNEGMKAAGFDYGVAVEALLEILTVHSTTGLPGLDGMPLLTGDMTWEHMTTSGFRLHQYKANHGGTW